MFTEKEVREARWAADLQVPMVAIQIVMDHAVSFYLTRISGQVKEDAERFSPTSGLPPEGYTIAQLRDAVVAFVRGDPCQDESFKNAIANGALALAAKAQAATTLRAEVERLQNTADVLRNMYQAAATRGYESRVEAAQLRRILVTAQHEVARTDATLRAEKALHGDDLKALAHERKRTNSAEAQLAAIRAVLEGRTLTARTALVTCTEIYALLTRGTPGAQ